MTFKKKLFYIETLGCKINQYESESIIYSLISQGYKLAKNIIEAHFIIINTCTVTSRADAKSRNLIRRSKRINPDSIIIVCGCFVDTDINILKEIKEVDIFIKNNDKDKITKIIKDFEQDKIKSKPYIFDSFNDGCFNFNPIIMNKHSRAFLKIQDGCNNNCSFCKIPFARGRSRSKNVNEIFNDIDNFQNNGYEEVVLTGINLGSYFYDNIVFSDLLFKLANKYKNIRFRISSIEPEYIDENFINSFKLSNICPHLHIPLQSGSDKILKLMNRKYNLNDYKNKIDLITRSKNDIFLSTDLILGFPDESEKDFKDIINLIKNLKFSFIHLFGFSPRKETIAYTLKPKIPERIRDERINILKSIVNELNYNYRKIFINKILEIIIESEKKGYYIGKSENYLNIFIKKNQTLKFKKKYKVKIIKIDNEYNYGILI